MQRDTEGDDDFAPIVGSAAEAWNKYAEEPYPELRRQSYSPIFPATEAQELRAHLKESIPDWKAKLERNGNKINTSLMGISTKALVYTEGLLREVVVEFGEGDLKDNTSFRDLLKKTKSHGGENTSIDNNFVKRLSELRNRCMHWRGFSDEDWHSSTLEVLSHVDILISDGFICDMLDINQKSGRKWH